MIELYTWTTPNGQQASIFLEETGLDYKVIPVDLQNGDQRGDEFTALNPNQKIPAIVDPDVKGDPVRLFESGAILIYLAEKTGTFLPQEGAERAEVLQWLMYQMSHVGPILGQANHFATHSEPIQYAIDRFINEGVRIVGVLNTGLEGHEYLAGQYSIADIATYPWVSAAWGPFVTMMPEKAGAMTNVKAWLDRLGAREAVQRGMAVPTAPA
ncbi:MAG: glutathione S-transferase N-terminal domain-containing protein [Candidatus Binatia bacterium]|nr:glutathione S-transferase N-terminal domain-containing protein [Candidatus Binatia bacterium]